MLWPLVSLAHVLPLPIKLFHLVNPPYRYFYGSSMYKPKPPKPLPSFTYKNA